MIDLRFFRSVPFSGATLTAVFAFGGYAGFLFLNTLYLQGVRDYSPLRAGICTVPLAIGALLLAPVSGRIVGVRGPRIPTVIAGAAILVAGAMLVGLRADTSLLWLLASYSVFAIGFGMVNVPITDSAVSGMARSQAGVAAAISSTSRQVGATSAWRWRDRSLIPASQASASTRDSSTPAGTPGGW